MTVDSSQHPVDYLSMYKETVTGIEGKCTGVGYKSGGNVLVALSYVKDGDPKSLFFDLSELEVMGDSRLEPDKRPNFPITFKEKYKEDKTGLVGSAAFLSYSANGCIQMEIIYLDQKGNPKSFQTDVQDFQPVSPTVPVNPVTNATNPGAPRASLARNL